MDTHLMSSRWLSGAGALAALAWLAPVSGQQTASAPANYVKVPGPLVALTHPRVIDGTGSPARDDQTVVIRDGTIASVGASTSVPQGANVIDLSGRTVLPGFVMMHEHLYYTTGPGVYGQL